jgi:hypothetical protein
VVHPHCNSQVEHTNDMVLQASKTASSTAPLNTPQGG